MNPALPEAAAEFADSAEKAFSGVGGLDCARRAERDPSVREEARGALDALGAVDIDPLHDVEQAAVAAELCRVSGRHALPYPVASLALSGSTAATPVAVAEPPRWRVDHGDVFAEWVLITSSGQASRSTAASGPLRSRLGPFVCELAVAGGDADVTRAVGAHAGGVAAMWLSLSAWRVLGTTERALELAVSHVCGREQFGRRLADFQAVRFQLADAAVLVDGLREMCRYTLWRLFADPGRRRTDSLALRLHALDAARSVLRTSQQLHGAAGFCDEYDISLLCRHVQPDLRLPFGAERTAAEMFRAVLDAGFEGVFCHGGPPA